MRLDCPPPNFDKYVCKYVFKIKSGLYVGDVNKKIREYIIDVLSNQCSNYVIRLIWNNAKSHSGFEFFEINGSSNKTTIDFDGIMIPKIQRKSTKIN